MKRQSAPASQLDLFGGAPSAVAERATQSTQAVALPPGTPPLVAEPVAQPKPPLPEFDCWLGRKPAISHEQWIAQLEPPQPKFDCYLHPLIRSRWYLVQRRWTCAVCYPQLKEN